MTIRQTALLCLISALISAAATEYFFPNVKTVTVDREVVRDDVRTVVHTVTLPNGSTDSTTTVIDHTVKSDVNTSTSVVKAPTVNLSALVTNDFSHGSIQPIYGISVSKQVMGPVTAGVFGFTNGTIGLSIGINF